MKELFFLTETYPFTLQPLPYAYNALEPYIDEETMHLHHDHHLKTYVEKLNEALEPFPTYHSWTLEELITNCHTLPGKLQTPVRHNAGGVYNHNLYFASMRPPEKQRIPEIFYKELCTYFGSWENFKESFSQAAVNQFGSGYAWLAVGHRKSLKIINTPNQDTPLTKNLQPILTIDVWEHAYYLKYKNMRADYIENWFNLINWDIVTQRYCE